MAFMLSQVLQSTLALGAEDVFRGSSPRQASLYVQVSSSSSAPQAAGSP